MRRAFTLVELLVAIGVLAVLGGMVTAALVSVNADARRARCQTQLVAMNAMLQSRLEQYLTLRVDAGGAIGMTPPSASMPPWVQLGTDSARLRLINMREQLRIEMPDRKSDLLYPLQTGTGVPNLAPTQAAIYHFDDSGRRMPAPSAGRISYQRPAPTTLMTYRRAIARMTGKTSFGADWADGWTEQYESSECLYLILASTVVAGRSGLEVVRKDQIADTDGDGVPEILDPWGTPIVWMRWPVGYWMIYGKRAQWEGMTPAQRLASILQTKQELGYDQYDPLRADWRNVDRGNAGSPEANNDTFNVPPVIVSAGPDGEFDLMLRSSDSSALNWQYGSPLAYGTMTWPQNGSTAVPAPYTSPYYYPDPFPRNYYGSSDAYYDVDYVNDAAPFVQTKTGGWVGAYYDADGDAVDDSADNLYSVRPL
ncbi:type II secretion system protein [Roseimaritima sediminicola]|uniref:type II secretion system protein n=1 Tax=Roseimaritima sediminicola TaxID=2662066 RepID=UPI00129825BE|nr:type II secretion system protein [Roseimaritima sediminicola]